MIRSRLVVTKTTPFAPRGMVTAEHPIGAEVGAAVLARGGNAVDAAVATAFAMTVVEPFMSTLAGAGTMLVHLAKRDETVTVDFNACAPASAHETAYRVIGGVSAALFPWPRVEGDANVFGPRSVAVPGSVAGLALALERYGTMTLADVLAPAVALARDGFVTDWYLALSTVRLMEEISAFPETARTYLRGGRFIQRPPGIEPGDHVRYPELAESLALVARDGPDVFYRGALAGAIHDHLRETGGWVTRDDLAAYRPRIEPALRGRYRDLDLAFSPGATGGVTALEILNILEQFPPARTGADTVAGLDLRARAVHRAFRDRFDHLGDPAVTKAPYERLASKDYAREVAREFRGAGRGPEAARGGGSARGAARRDRTRSAPPAPARRREDVADCTTQICVVDRQRNMVSLTHTAVSLYGARMVVPGTGILLNNGMIWFDPEPGKPNSVGPGKRVLCNMTPALGFRRGKAVLALGAPGGRRIVSAIPQVIATLVDGRTTLQAAVEAPRLHAEGAEVLVDDRVGDRAVAGLRARGHDVVPKTESYSSLNFAKPVGVRVTPKGLEAGVDHLRAAAAAGH